jgi:hypothetical protein
MASTDMRAEASPAAIEAHKRSTEAAVTGAVLVAALCSGVTLLLLLAAIGRGLDFTDEGFYLNSIEFPDEGAAHVSNFGPTYGAVTAFLGGEIVHLRWFNLITTLMAALIFANSLTRYVTARLGTISRWARACSLMSVAVPVVAAFTSGHLTPNYNSLTIVGLLLIAAGFIDACSRPQGVLSHGVAVLLVGLGGALTFLGKPSSALVAALVVGVGMATLGRKQRLIGIEAMLVATAGTFGASYLLTQHPTGLLDRVFDGMSRAPLLGAGHDLASMLSPAVWVPRLDLPWLLLTALLAIAGFAWARLLMGHYPSSQRRALLVIALVVAAVAPLVMQLHLLSYNNNHRELLVLGPALGVAAGARSTPVGRGETWGVAAVLTLLPFALSFGSNNNYWHVASLLLVFWFMAGVVIGTGGSGTERSSMQVILAGAVPALVITLLALSSWVSDPFRQPVALFSQDTTIDLGRGGSLSMAKDYATAIGNLQRDAVAEGFRPGTPVIDLTGSMPGMIYALEGRPVGSPWIIGGYPGSRKVAELTLAQARCEDLASAWLLLEEDGERSIDASVLSTLGATIEGWDTASTTEISSVPDHTRYISLLSPVGSSTERTNQCLAARQ